jgi:hypothetical protein
MSNPPAPAREVRRCRRTIAEGEDYATEVLAVDLGPFCEFEAVQDDGPAVLVVVARIPRRERWVLDEDGASWLHGDAVCLDGGDADECQRQADHRNKNSYPLC